MISSRRFFFPESCVRQFAETSGKDTFTAWARLTVAGDMLDYSGNTATSTVDITTFKILINSTLSTKDAKIDN
jgi:hypothetical protein